MDAQAVAHDDAVARLEQQVGLLLRRARSVLSALAARAHPDLDAGGFAVLAAIGRAAPRRLADLVEEFALDKSTMSRHVSGLLRLGLVARRPDPADGRAYLLELTPEGRARFDSAVTQRRRYWHASLGGWTTEDVLALADGLDRLNAALAETQVTD
jgi:DNA-binding MarR family transcriptional regulator